jgi:hypothetical protein
MPEFFQTAMGRTFYEGTMPRIAKALDRIATALESQAQQEHVAPVVPTPSMPEVLDKPMTAEQLKAVMDEHGYLTACVEMDFNDILTGDLDTFNDEVSEKITGSEVGLQDIAYSVVGHRPGVIGHVIVQITAAVTDDVVPVEDAE